MKKRVLFFLCITFAGAASGVPLTPETVNTYIDSNGSQAAREAFFECGNESRAKGYEMVQEGSDAWLRVAARLLDDSDGCYTIGLQSAIARAQIKNPEGVLKLVGSTFKLGPDYICVPFMVDEVDPLGIKEQLRTLGRLERALERVKASSLQKRKKECLERVRSMQEDIRTQLKVSRPPVSPQ